MSNNDSEINIKKIAVIIIPVLLLIILGSSRIFFRTFGEEIILASNAEYLDLATEKKETYLVLDKEKLTVERSNIDDEVLSTKYQSYSNVVYAELERKDGIDVVRRIKKDIPKNKKYLIGYLGEFMDENKNTITLDPNFDKGEVIDSKLPDVIKYVVFNPKIYYPYRMEENIEPGKYKSVYYKLGETYIFSHDEKLVSN